MCKIVLNIEVLKNRISSSVESVYGKYVKVLSELVKIPTVSAWGGDEIKEGCETLVSMLRERGWVTTVVSGGGNPVVVAELGSGSRTVMFYNHYDVQPPDPLDEWFSNPFNLVEKEGFLFGRGVADNKGNIVARMAAAELIQPYLDDLDLKLKFVIEGEEEIGSPTLSKVVEEYKDLLYAEAGFWETGYVGRDDALSISLGFKGMLYVEVVVRGPNRDVHSGNAPLIPNPAWRIARLLTTLKDDVGNVKVPGFYDDIDKEFLRNSEELLKKLDPEELNALKKELGVKEFVGGVEGFEAYRKLLLTPSLNVSGLYAGYTGKGSKTIVPSKAGVKIDIRLLPGQDPLKILNAFKEYLRNQGFADAELFVESMYRSGYTNPNETIVRASVKAAEETYGKPPKVMPISAGSGPMYLFTHILRIPMTGAGVGYYGSRVHAPNENIRVKDFIRGMKHVALTLIEYALMRESERESSIVGQLRK